MSEGLQVRRSVRERLFRILGVRGFFGKITQFFENRGKLGPVVAHRMMGYRARDRVPHTFRKKSKGRTVFHPDLAAEQIEPVDSVSSLVDHIEPVIAPVLLDGKITRIAAATMDLNGEIVGLETPLARPALGDGRQQLEEPLGVGGSLRIAGSLLVNQARAVEFERERAL